MRDNTKVTESRPECAGPTPIRKELSVSFEFFPPATNTMAMNLWATIVDLAPLRPAFVSVTYGAGGSTRTRTHETVKRLVQETDLTPAAHLTCVAASRNEIDDVIRGYHDAGIRHIVALRGDAPGSEKYFTPHPDGYRNAAELVAGIRRIGEFEISVAAYPEKHPDAPNLQADLDNLKRKIDAGASRAITQFFFDSDAYLRFVDRARAAGISVPIIPGILPVTNFTRVKQFAQRCGTRIPTQLHYLFDGLDDNPGIRKLLAASVAIAQCEELRKYGVRQFHFYTLNRAELTRAICHKLGLRPVVPATGPTIRDGAA